MDEPELVSGAVPVRRPAYIRQVKHDDLAALHDVDEAVFGKLAYPMFVLRQFIDVHQRHFLVADAGPLLLGYVLAGYAAGSHEAWLLGLGVRAEARNRGYGRALLERCLERLKNDGACSVRLSVEPDNHAAIKLYESTAFKLMGFYRDYYGPGEDRFEMRAFFSDDQSCRAETAPAGSACASGTPRYAE